MLNTIETPTRFAAQLRILEVLQDGAHTWAEIQDITGFNNDYLGVVLADLLLAQRKLRTEHRGDVRLYSLRP